LTEALKQTGVNFTVMPGQAAIALKAVDKDNDGKLSKNEMLTLYKYFFKNIDSITGQK
jgi:hypothetical protein